MENKQNTDQLQTETQSSSQDLDVMIDLCVIPIGQGASVSKEIVECEKIIQSSGLDYKLHAYGTNISGKWDDVFAVVKKCHQTLHDKGVVRISSNLKVGTRIDKKQSIQDKIDKVANQL